MKKVMQVNVGGVEVRIYENDIVVVMGAKRFYGTTTAPEDSSTLWPHLLDNEERLFYSLSLIGLQSKNGMLYSSQGR
ncbi:hypothetical protein HKL94_02825 [Candidatus Parcubacteria bacterium]|nr:hypothetical protein [Candidatus Parcubacteria bacterium]